jgi:hypothetical protein
MFTPEQEKTESINIEVDNKKFTLVIKSISESMTFIVIDPEEIDGFKYIRTKTLKEIKEIEGLKGLKNCGQFSDFLKKLAEKKQLLLSKKENKISISFTVEFLFEKTNVEIDLFPEKANTDDIIKHLCKEINSLKEEIKVLKMNKKENLENENKELKNSIENIKKENISLKEEIKEIKKILEPINNKFKEKLEKIEKKKNL